MTSGLYSFRSLFVDGGRVEIPVIQRDYAQGRNDDRSKQVRERFVEALGETLSANPASAPLELDFVYGDWSGADRTFKPLDGQQRLTTLFLLHWYLACRDDVFPEFQGWISDQGRSHFTYRTRPSAEKFFNALVRHPAPVDQLPANSRALSFWVTDSVWFITSWLRDPTVHASLTMLDALHARLSEMRGAWARMVSTERPAIVFHVLRLEDYGLSDDSYVTMNARGKALTALEVFKAELEAFVGQTYSHQACPHSPDRTWRQYVVHRFDTAWMDLLWSLRARGDDIDSRFMHLIRALAVVRCVDSDDEHRSAKQIDRLLATTEPALHVYRDIGCLDTALVDQIISVLDTLCRYPEAPTFLAHAQQHGETQTLERILLAKGANQEDGLGLVHWVLFYGWCSFLVKFRDKLDQEAVRQAFHDWARVVSNLAVNSDIDRNDRLVAAFRGLRQLSEFSGEDFLAHVAEGRLDQGTGFNQEQRREERVKALLILRGTGWKELVERAERHRYFRGDIGFLLRFAGVWRRVEEKLPSDWSDAEDAEHRGAFADWYGRACAIFPEEGASQLTSLPEFVWERALLATGDYLLPRGANWSLLDDKDRDASWKRLLRADTKVIDREQRREVVRSVLSRIDPADVAGSLRRIVEAGVQGEDATPAPGVRRRLVAEPRLIEFCWRRMLRVEEGTAFLLRRLVRGGTHVDLYLYNLYLQLLERMEALSPFYQAECKPVNVVRPPTRLQLQSRVAGLSLTAEKAGAEIALTLQLPPGQPALSSQLSGWTTENEARLTRTASPDEAEQVILDVAASLRDRQPNNDGTQSKGAEDGTGAM